MSNAFYDNIWHDTLKNLETLTIIDYENQAQDPQFNRTQLQTEIYELYIKYILIANKLEDVYDKIVQPQKRLLIRKLLDACLGRIIEFKHDLVNIDMMEFNYNDSIIDKLKLTPNDIEINIPKYFKRENFNDIEQKKQFINDLYKKLGWLDEDREDEKLTEIDAIKLIQIHERARQGRLRAHFMKEIRMLKEKGKTESEKKGPESGLVAAMRIQKVWRGHTARRKTRRRKLEEMVLIGMIPPESIGQTKKSEEIEKMNSNINRRYEIQKKYKEDFEKALKDIKDEIKNKQGSTMMEDIADDIRIWYKDYYDKTGKFPEFPSEEHGGSRHLFSRQGTESEMSRSSARSSKESRKTKDKSKSPARSGDLNIEENFETGYKPIQSNFLPDIKAAVDEFKDTWKDKDETLNFHQTYYEDMIYTEKYSEVEMELRQVVDNLMRQELELLQLALDRDRQSKGKKVKKSSKKARRSGKKSKKKKEKDLTPDRTTESLFEELITNGIIKKYPEISLKSYLGDRAYIERTGIDPCPGDIRQLITEYCILPLGSDTIRNFCPCIRSLLIAGPKGTGKKNLLHAICTEVGATLFDITPMNIAGKYPGKSGLIMLIHLILKVSRLLQPSVIYMGDAERPYMKKIPKTDRSDPKRLKKDLIKIVRNIQIEDRVMLIGITNLPWEADQKLLQQTYNRFIYIPRPDYGTLSFAWKELINQYTGGYTQFDYSIMAKISDGYTIGSIVSCIQDVMTCKRKLQLKSKPLTHVEFINALCIHEPVYKEEEETFISWWSKTPLGRRRQKALEMELEAKQEEAAAATDGKKSTKKSK